MEISNRTGRIKDLVNLLDDIASHRHLYKDKLASFKGRLLFATNHLDDAPRCALSLSAKR